MKDVLWVLGIVLVTGFGLATWRIPLVRRLDLGARLSVAFAGGCVVLAVLMFGFALVHVPFTRWTLLIALVVCICGVRRPCRRCQSGGMAA
ncbi:MAG TPA: hypothetical protein VI670_07040, partial [Thermoanaerobaculia bacterium]